jgi:hypothetical protein
MGQRLALTSGIDIDDHVGWLDHALANEVADLADLNESARDQLLAAADRHHAPPAPRTASPIEGGAA